MPRTASSRLQVTASARIRVASAEPSIARADAAPLAGPDDQVALAAVERRLGSAEAAYQRLRRHLSHGDVSAWAVESFAQAALETRHAGEAAPLLRRVRARLGAPADAADEPMAGDGA